MHELRVDDLEHPDSMVRWEAVLLLHALYVPVGAQYEQELWAAHEKLVGAHTAELWMRSKHSPTLSSDEIYARTQDRSWWPEEYLAEERRRYGG